MAKALPEALSEKEKLSLRVQSINKVIFIPKTISKKPGKIVAQEKTKVGPYTFHKQDDDSFIHFDESGQPTILGEQSSGGVWRLMFDKNIHGVSLSCLSTDFGKILPNYKCASVDHMSSLTNIQHKFAVQNCANSFNKLPVEIRKRIYQYATTRDFIVVERWTIPGYHRLDHTKTPPSLLLNVQLSCRYLYEDIATFNYEHNEFYLSDPQAAHDLLDCLEQGPINTMSSRHFGVVILDIRKNSYNHSQAFAMPAFALEEGDWDEHLRILMKHVWFAKSRGKGDGEDVLRKWAEAVRRLLQSCTVGKLVIHGADNWPSALYSTTEVVKTLSEFKGQGRITQVCKAGTWPKNGFGKVMEMLKNTIELDSPVEKKTKSKVGGWKSEIELNAGIEAKIKSKAGGQKRKIEPEPPAGAKRMKSKAGEEKRKMETKTDGQEGRTASPSAIKGWSHHKTMESP